MCHECNFAHATPRPKGLFDVGWHDSCHCQPAKEGLGMAETLKRYYRNQAVNELVSALLDDVKKQALLLLSGPITAR